MEEYYTAFRYLVRETVDRTGIELSTNLELYTTKLMASYVDRTDLDSDETFAEQLLRAHTQTACKTVGDRALMVHGWFPTRRRSRGLHKFYYSDIGRAAYARCTAEIFGELNQQFEIVAELMRAVPNNRSVKLVNLET